MQDLYQEAMRFFQARKIPEAEARFRAILEQNPGNVDAARMLGVTLSFRGKFNDASALLEDVVRQVPEFFHAYVDLAQIRAQQEQFDEAIRLLNEVLRLSPDLLQARQLLEGVQAQKREAGSSGGYGTARADDQDTASLIRHAVWLTSNGKPDKAEETYRRVLELDPENYHARVGQAGLAHNDGNFLEAEKFLKLAEEINAKALSVRRGFQRLYDAMAHFYKDTMQLDDAESTARLLTRYDPDSGYGWSLLGGILIEQLKLDESLAAFDKSLAIDPNQPEAFLSRGDILKSLGRRKECEASWRDCVKLAPNLGSAWWALANLKTLRFDASDVRIMKSCLEQGETGSDNEACLHFALGKAYSDLGDSETSFEHYLVGNQIMHERYPFDLESFRSRCDRAKQVFSEELFAENASRKTFDVTPIFVVGLPRSGSTLLEQILASHSLVEGTMELTHISGFAAQIDTSSRQIGEMGRDDFESSGERYMQATRRYYGDARYFIDKMPDNFAHIGLIKLMLPQAIIIDARRHPMDCCFSMFKQMFEGQHTFSYDFESLGAYYNGYLDLMKHWSTVLPGQIHLVHYERVVSDTEFEIKQLLKHCGLEFEEDCLRFHETDRAVFSASADQVRDPVDDRGVEKWREFEEQLAPLNKALGGALGIDL